MLLARFHDAFAAIGFPQYADLLFGRGSFAFHNLGAFNGRRLTLQVAQILGDHRIFIDTTLAGPCNTHPIPLFKRSFLVLKISC